jgi:hypothetical protein
VVVAVELILVAVEVAVEFKLARLLLFQELLIPLQLVLVALAVLVMAVILYFQPLPQQAVVVAVERLLLEEMVALVVAIVAMFLLEV